MTLLRRLQVPHNPEELPPTYLINHDVKPIERERRSWTWLIFLSLWGTVAFNMSNWQLGASLLAVGLNWWQSFLATLIGHAFAAAIVVVASFPGLYYNIAFPVSMRIAWGFNGSIFVVLNRILLSIIWFGVQSWQGGLMTYVCLRAMWPSIDNIPATFPTSTGMTLPQFVGFIVYFVIQLPFLLLSPKQLRWLVTTSTAVGFLVQLILLIWACATMDKFGSVLSNDAALAGGNLGWMFMYGITVTMSSITSGTLSVCDYARFASTPASGQWSQFVGFLPAWLSNVFGIITVAGTQDRFGTQLWSVVELLVAIQDANPTHATRAAVWFAAFAFLVCQLALNVVGNSFSGGTDMSTLLPKWINIRRGQYLTAILGLVINPWYLVSGAIIFISVMSAYTIFLQPFLGIIIAYYFLLQKERIKVQDLYRLKGQSIYWYNYGVNWRAVVAWLVGVMPHIPGFLNVVRPSITVSSGAKHIYYLCSITSFLLAFAVALALGYAFPVAAQKEFIASVTRDDARTMCEEFINSPDILRAENVPVEVSHVFDGEKMSEKSKDEE
ncbi:permease for cytosine/purines, uracil, thiamine, allantoin-domain-containing protein [Exophiala viscosa]|uniref:Permease for cytosine/purines, uracil, thiamine, allantoin-domain-containing protein n=1 Tax=Exophiala viscosa TaxID=2486360 RepID=A0AAN6E1U3_9EURO|nr:permease for cytosine/purines, uracil, thiamine, allantoin-domain-containing protein [Exophiala viscosa]